MPYNIGLNSIIEISVESFIEGQQVLSLFHYKYSVGSTIADGRAAALAAITAFKAGAGVMPQYLACCSNNVDNFHIYAQWITPLRYAYVRDPGPDLVGTFVGDPLPVNVACAVTKLSDRAGRRFIGTLHMPAVPLEFVVGSEVTDNGKELYAELGTKMLTSIILPGGGEATPVIFNRATPSESPLITDFDVQNFSRTMRRRTVGLGS